MRTQPLLVAIFMLAVSVIYTSCIYDNIILPYHIAHMSVEWIWLSIPAFTLLLGALWIMLVHGVHTFDIEGEWVAKDMHVLDKHNLNT